MKESKLSLESLETYKNAMNNPNLLLNDKEILNTNLHFYSFFSHIN